MSNDIARDQAARQAIGAELGETLFVEAGAGSGKTKSLIDRVIALIDEGVAMENIAAITFTEKAAAELANRVREILQERLSESDRSARPTEVARYRAALDQLDGAAVTTLHGFALRILSQHAIEAELPPRVEVSTLQDFEDRWEEIRDDLLDDPAHREIVVTSRQLGIGTSKLRQMAEVLEGNWDLVESRIINRTPAMLPDLSDVWRSYAEVAELATQCLDAGDRMYERLVAIGEMGERLRRGAHDRFGTIGLLFGRQPSFKVGNVGRRSSWPDTFTVEEVRLEVNALGSTIEARKAQVIDAVIEQLCHVLGGAVMRAAEERRRRGVLEFHDLLVLARRMLCHPERGPGIRAALAARYRRLLLDEFQDTDPIQMDIAALIAATGHVDHRSPARAETEPGRLFFVGDAKQSIYRFRRADIALFMMVQETSGFRRLSLTRNFRTVHPVLVWINDLFDGLMEPTIEAGVPAQPEYQPLTPVRDRAPSGAPVAALGATEHPAKSVSVGEMRETEATEVANAILTAVSRRWSVDDGSGGWRPARFEDICVLLPTRTSLPQLEQALEDAEIPYRIEAGSLIWASRAVRDLMFIVRTLADPTDEVALVNALRSPAFGCGDDDLYTFKVTHRGRWSYLRPPPAGLPADHPVGEAMAWLADVHARCRWLTPSELIRTIVRDRRLMELGCFDPRRARDVWRSLRMVIEQARAFGETEQARIAGRSGGGLREFVSWVDLKINRQERESESVLSETDDDAVRITTIHGAKGRQFPIVVLSGTHTPPPPTRVEVIWPPEGGYGVRLTKTLSTTTYVANRPGEDTMAHAERVRLLYVALTRARDHLVVSCHRRSRSERSEAPPSLAEMVAEHASDLPAADLAPVPAPNGQLPAPQRRSPEGWRAEREAALRAAARRLTIAASSVWQPVDGTRLKGDGADGDSEWGGAGGRFEEDGLAGLDKAGSGDEGDRSVWRTGRYGSAFGRAVHAALQTVAFEQIEGRVGDGEAPAAPQASWEADLRRLAEHHASAEGVSVRADDVAQRVRRALSTPIVREAARQRHWRELYAGAEVEGRLLEGFIDLLYEAPDGSFVVVDYKTHDSDDRPDLRHKPGYRLQIAAYALMITEATGQAVSRCVFVFLGPDSVHEVEVEDLDEAIEEVRHSLAEDGA